jgi:hypothetical protein
MSPKQWFALLAFYISYLFFGASVFYHFEQKLEIKKRQEELKERIAINGNYLIFYYYLTIFFFSNQIVNWIWQIYKKCHFGSHDIEQIFNGIMFGWIVFCWAFFKKFWNFFYKINCEILQKTEENWTLKTGK